MWDVSNVLYPLWWIDFDVALNSMNNSDRFPLFSWNVRWQILAVYRNEVLQEDKLKINFHMSNIDNPLNNQVNKFYCLFLDITKFLIHLVFLSPKINILLSFNLLSFANPDTCVSRLFRKSWGIIIAFYSISFKLMQCHSWYQNSFYPEGQKFSPKTRFYV